jgi:SulP family sulfate permease
MGCCSGGHRTTVSNAIRRAPERAGSGRRPSTFGVYCARLARVTIASMARTRYSIRDRPIPLAQLPGAALRAVLREGYSRRELRQDVLAGVVVGIVALPLAMALAIAVGVAPQFGLYTAIVAGLVIAALGGSRTQVSGPTAAFIVILAPIQAKFGLGGLLVSGLIGGLMLILMGLLRLGRLIEFVPHPVTTGFTAGIGTVIATLQVKDLLGLQIPKMPEHFLERIVAMARAIGTASPWEALIGALTLTVLVVLPRYTRRIPPPVVALPAVALVAVVLDRLIPSFEVATIASRFSSVVDGHVVHGIPRAAPSFMWPWSAPGPGGQPFDLSFATIRDLFPGAFAVAMLGAIESLLSAVVADGMARTRHDPDAELLAQGVGNVVAPFLGGIPATGAIARTATNIRSGARSPIAAMVHAVTVLAAIVALAPLIGYLPMAGLAALLLLVAWNMSEVKHFVHIVRVAPRADMAVLLTCYTLTVVFDMVVSVTVGVMLAALLFMRRMAEVTSASLSEGENLALTAPLPKGVLVYDVSGPLFFGAAQKAMATLGQVDSAKVVILRLDQVPAMDATGLVALESAIKRLEQSRTLTIISGLRPQPSQVVHNAHIVERPGTLLLRRDVEASIAAARAHLEGLAAGRAAAEAAVATFPGS